jgi:hypothetical protein
MNQEETSETIKETFNVSLNESEILPKEKPGKLKYTIAIISTLVLLAAATTLLIGYFKFNWFQSEIYKVDVNVVRNLNQANYFTETKKITTKVALTEEGYEEQEYLIDTNFMVFLNERKQLKKDDYINTASIVLLKSKLTSTEGNQDLPSFDLFNEETRKEFEANPDGSKYPMALFSFYENGTIIEVRLPDTMDKFNAETIMDLIEKVIPKLSRNKTEDNENGLDIKTRKDKKKKTLIEEEKPKQYYSFKGSKYSRTFIRDFEDDQITNIKSNSNIHLQTTPEDEEEKPFGAKDFYFNTESNIVSTEIKEGQKESADLLSELSKKFSLVNADTLLEKLNEPEQEEEIPEEETNPELRNLGYSITADQTFKIGTYNVLGQTVTVKYHVAVTNGRPKNEIIIVSKLGTTTIGNTGVTLSGSWSKSIPIFKFAFPAFPLISISAKATGSISWKVSVTSGSGSGVKLAASLNGKISLGAEIKAGVDIIVSYSAGVEGIIVNASGSAAIQNRKVTKNFSISGRKIYVYLKKSVFGKKKTVAEKTLYNGW